MFKIHNSFGKNSCDDIYLRHLFKNYCRFFLKKVAIISLTESSVFSEAQSSSAVNLSGIQDLTRNKNIIRPLALPGQLVGNTFATGNIFSLELIAI